MYTTVIEEIFNMPMTISDPITLGLVIVALIILKTLIAEIVKSLYKKVLKCLKRKDKKDASANTSEA